MLVPSAGMTRKRTLDVGDDDSLTRSNSAGGNPDESDRSVMCCSSVRRAADALLAEDILATFVKRPLPEHVADAFNRYMASAPRWPDTEGLHPLEATHDRVAIVEFSLEGETVEEASGYGRNLPSRHNPDVASAKSAMAQVFSVLPKECAATATLDASALLEALHHCTGRRQFILRLEYILGDTCQRWHRDQNICRTIITYTGPGTHVAHERGVTRGADGCVDAANGQQSMQVEAGDLLLMKGGLWQGSQGVGAAHRAPAIGPVPTCTAHRLMLKVDISEDF
jgi:hypothetical protein